MEADEMVADGMEADEGAAFFKRIGGFVRRVARVAAPILRRIARVVAPIAGAAVAGGALRRRD
jgi:hypothetical protein